MSTKSRRLVVAATIVAWVTWLSLYTLSRTGADPTVVHLVGLQASQMVAGILTVAAILGYLVAPVLTTAQLWREIGIKEQQRHCDDCPLGRRRFERLTNIIPIRFDGRVERSFRN